MHVDSISFGSGNETEGKHHSFDDGTNKKVKIDRQRARKSESQSNISSYISDLLIDSYL